MNRKYDLDDNFLVLRLRESKPNEDILKEQLEVTLPAVMYQSR